MENECIISYNYLLKGVIIFIFTAFFFLERRSFAKENTQVLEADRFEFLPCSSELFDLIQNIHLLGGLFLSSLK